MSRIHRRGPWLAEEDDRLLQLVASGGPNNWVQISNHMHLRSPKQCRERYHQNLKSSLNHEPISVEEGEAIEQMVNEMGKKWAEIARRLGNRSDNAVKNWWNGSQNRRKRFPPSHAHSSKTLSNRRQPLPVMRSPEVSSRHHNRRYGHDSPMGKPHRTLGISRPRPTHDISPPSGLSHDHWDEQPSPTTLRRFGQGDESRPSHLHLLAQASAPPLSRMPSTLLESRGPTLPPLGPIDTSIASHSSTPTTLQPPLSAVSLDRAPSLVSDHNSVYSISPRTWPSPRPDMLANLDTIRARWPEGLQIDRRTSAPNISRLISPYTEEDGDLAGLTTYVSSDPKYQLPLPLNRSTSTDGQVGIHQQHSSISTISLSPIAARAQPAQDSSAARDARMKFSSLLN